jgi:hypothetical protein
VQLDEYGNQLSNYREKEEALGKLKAYSGKQHIDIRTMRNDGYSYKHNVTFLMTANKNPLMLEDGDRRVALFNTPNKLDVKFRDIAKLIEAIESQVLDFCYYLATEVEELSRSDYMRPYESADKQVLIADSMYPAARIVYVIKHKMFDYLKNLADDYNVPHMAAEIDSGRIKKETMEDFYFELTDGKGDVKSLNKMLKADGIPPIRTSHNGEQTFYYKVLNEDTVLFTAE